MGNYSVKLIGLVAAFTLIVGAVVWSLFYYCLPQFYPNWFIPILLFFLVFESLEVLYIQRSSLKATGRQLLNSYLLTKIVKIFAAIILIGVYYFTEKEGLKNFVFIFIIFYILFLFMETIIFLKIEKRLKEKK